MLFSKPVPPEEMYLYKWYTPEHKLWYYYTPVTNKLSLGSMDESIYPSLDVNLKSIVPYLHRAGFKTLPSCEGHFHGAGNLKNKYKHLISDYLKIKGAGLKLKETEGDSIIHYQNSKHEFPWSNYLDFQNEVLDSMRTGYLGIVDLPLDWNNVENIEFKTSYAGNSKITHIIVHNKSSEMVAANWLKVFELIKRTL